MKNQKTNYSKGFKIYLAAAAVAGSFLIADITRMKYQGATERQVERTQAIPQENYNTITQKEVDFLGYHDLENSVSSTNMPFAENFDYAPEKNDVKKIQPKNEEIKSKRTEPSHPVTPEFIAKLIKQESRDNPYAVSHKGARGLMQIMKPTWNEMTQKLYGQKLSYDQMFNPEINAEVGTNHLFELDELLTNSLPHYRKSSIKEQQKHIAAAYNGGPTKLIQRKGRINQMPRETQKYVKIVCRR